MRTTSCFCLLLFISIQITAQNALQDSLQKKLDQIVKAEKIPGATFAAVLPDGSLVNIASGWADKEAKEAMEPGARMLAGSTGKMFVGALAFKVMRYKDIALDSTIAQWFDEEEWYSRIPNSEQLTIRMLLNHTSGLPRYIFQPKFLKAVRSAPQRRWTPEERLSFILDLDPVHAPGQGWSYSDTNYILLGMLIEKWTGENFYTTLRKRLIGLMALKDTRPSYKSQLEGITQAYIEEENFFNLPQKVVRDGHYAMNPQFEWTGGGLLSNTVDLARFIKQLHEKKTVPAPYYQEMLKPVDLKSGQPAGSGYGLSTFVWTTPHGLHYGHSGYMPGYLTAVEYVKDHKFSMAMQYNSDRTLGKNQHRYMVEMAKIIIEKLN